jgi:hypothetical protein
MRRNKDLAMERQCSLSVRPKRRPKGWTPERRASAAARIRLSQPWRHATGPSTEAGKARVAMNALRHGHRSRAWILRAQRIRNAIRLCARTVLLARVLMAERDRRVSPNVRTQMERARSILTARSARPLGADLFNERRAACGP